MKKIEASLKDFLNRVQVDFIGLIMKIEQMRGNMTRLIEDRKKSESLLYDEQKRQGKYKGDDFKQPKLEAVTMPENASSAKALNQNDQ